MIIYSSIIFKVEKNKKYITKLYKNKLLHLKTHETEKTI